MLEENVSLFASSSNFRAKRSKPLMLQKFRVVPTIDLRKDAKPSIRCRCIAMDHEYSSGLLVFAGGVNCPRHN